MAAMLKPSVPGVLSLVAQSSVAGRRRAICAARGAAGLGAEEFPRHLIDLMGLLGDRRTATGLWDRFSATPAAASTPTVVLLGASGFSAQLAGQLGLPFAFAHHFDTGGTLQALDIYRQHFVPSVTLEEPYAIVTANILVADTDEEAAWFAAPGQLMIYLLRCGRPTQLLTPEDAAVHPDLPIARQMPTNRILGSPSTAVARVEALIEQTEANEIMVSSFTQGIEERLHSLELLAEAW